MENQFDSRQWQPGARRRMRSTVSADYNWDAAGADKRWIWFTTRSVERPGNPGNPLRADVAA